MTERRIITREIVQSVVDEERQERFDRLLEVEREIDRVADEKAGANKDYNAEIKDLRKARKSLMDTLDSGLEKVELKMYEVADEHTLEVHLHRVDNDERVPEFTRPMTPDERQSGIPFGEATSAAEPTEDIDTSDNDEDEDEDEAPESEDVVSFDDMELPEEAASA